MSVEGRGSVEGYDVGDGGGGEHENAQVQGQGRRRATIEQMDGCMPTTIYPSDIPEALPWENDADTLTIEVCVSHHKKLTTDLNTLDLPAESHQSLQIVLQSLDNFINAYKSMGPTTDGFFHLLQRRKIEVMGPDKWGDVEKNVSKAQAISMFNFKEGPKQKMLKVQYFKHPDIAHHLYDRFLAAYGRLPWNDEVPHYFARFFYVELFLNTRPDYTDLSSK